jgi:hypothetical protein
VERVHLRAIAIEFPSSDTEERSFASGVMLPDSRILVAMDGGVRSIANEAALQREYPGAQLHFFSQADETMNYTGEEADAV